MKFLSVFALIAAATSALAAPTSATETCQISSDRTVTKFDGSVKPLPSLMPSDNNILTEFMSGIGFLTVASGFDFTGPTATLSDFKVELTSGTRTAVLKVFSDREKPFTVKYTDFDGKTKVMSDGEGVFDVIDYQLLYRVEIGPSGGSIEFTVGKDQGAVTITAYSGVMSSAGSLVKISQSTSFNSLHDGAPLGFCSI